MKSGHSNRSLSFENKTLLPFSGLAGYNAWSHHVFISMIALTAYLFYFNRK